MVASETSRVAYGACSIAEAQGLRWLRYLVVDMCSDTARRAYMNAKRSMTTRMRGNVERRASTNDKNSAQQRKTDNRQHDEMPEPSHVLQH